MAEKAGSRKPAPGNAGQGEGFLWLPGRNKAASKQLASAGIHREEEFLWWLPFRYEDRRAPLPLSSVGPETVGCFKVKILAVKARRARRRGIHVTEGLVADDTGSLHVIWFNRPWLQNQLPVGSAVYLYGKVSLFAARGGLRLQLENPAVEKVPSRGGAAVHSDRIVPVYRKAGSLGSRALRTLFHKYFLLSRPMADPLPEALRKESGIAGREEAFRGVHFPGDDVDLEDLGFHKTPFQERLAFEELLAYQWAVLSSGRERKDRAGVRVMALPETGDLLRKILPFKLTGAQRRVLREIVEDLGSEQPMMRLLHGDVGSGKTVVAFLAMVMAAHQGFQAAFMAPTEVLARQQFLKLREMTAGAGLEVVFLAASVKGKERRETLGRLGEGTVRLVVGTHSLFQEGVVFHRLGLAVIDEQHRFGVEQRARLVAKGENPNLLVMSATPIPRSLAMTLYGDLDLSVIDELPPGRQRVVTLLREQSARHRMEAFLRKEMDAGRQVFTIFPMVEESEAVDLGAAVDAYEAYRAGPFRGYPAALLHGRMPSLEKDKVMSAVRAGEVKLLVATTVVEVGVDLPQASVIVVEHAERFGLAQLHQLRGRVGRGGQKGYCVLMMSKRASPEAKERLAILERSDDGFEIAEADLSLRGAGTVMGTRQWGGTQFRLANPLRNMNLLEKARSWANKLAEPGFPWQDGEKEAFVRWAEGFQSYWGGYGRIG